MPITNLTLKSKIDSFISNINIYSDVLTPEELISLSLSLKSVNETNILTVPTVADLPLIAPFSPNHPLLIFVQSINSYAISSGNRWLTLDGRILEDFNSNVVWAWGYNNVGSLGDGTNTARSSPVSVVGGFTDWCGIAAGNAHSLGIRANDTAWAWGCNNVGALGDGTTTDRSSPVSVVGGFTDWCRVSAGRCHSLGIRANGTVWAWGENIFGSLGDNTTTNRSSPVSVVGGFTDWCQVSSSSYHSLGIRANGTVWAWGCGGFGRLGDGTTTGRSSPVSVVGGFTDWCAVAGGAVHSLGVRTNGTAWSWGYNLCGRLGDGTTTGRSSPVSVVGGFTDWCGIAAGNAHSLGVRANGTVWAWGFNGQQGRLGDGFANNQSSPVSVVGGFTDWCHVSAGGQHNLAVRTNGTVWSWGYNGQGRLGDGTTTNRSSPVSVVGGFTDWCGVSAGVVHSLGIRTIT